MNELNSEQKLAMRAVGSPQSSSYQDLKNIIIKYALSKVDPVLIDTYKVNRDLGNRNYLPMSLNPSLGEILGNKAEALAKGNGIIATVTGPRYVTHNPETGMMVLGPSLEAKGRGKLAKNGGESTRQRFANDVFKIALEQHPNLTEEELESRGARKYEMSNAKGKEAHHMYPISYSGRVLNEINNLGLKDEVINEMNARHLYVGDQAKNIAPLQTKSNRLGPSEYLEPLDNLNKIDIHDKVHARAEELLGYGGLPVRTNVAEGSTIEDFMRDSNKTDFQKVNYAIAVPEAHRAAMLAENLDLNKDINQTKMINELINLAALKTGASMKVNTGTENLLKSLKLIRRS